MNTNDISDLDELGSHIGQALWDAEAAKERADAIDKIGTLIDEELETVIWPDTKEALTELLQHCRTLFAVAFTELEDARQRHEESRRAWDALHAK